MTWPKSRFKKFRLQAHWQDMGIYLAAKELKDHQENRLKTRQWNERQGHAGKKALSLFPCLLCFCQIPFFAIFVFFCGNLNLCSRVQHRAQFP
jgi:hypothetical protein